MERDFMGLSSKEPVIVVKEEVNNDVCKEIGFSKGSAIQWPFSNKISAVPQFMSFKVSQEDKNKKIVSDHLGSSGFMPFSGVEVYEHNQRRGTAEAQKSFNLDRQGGTHISLTAYSVPHDVHSVLRSHDVKTFPVSNQAIPVSINNPVFKNQFATIGQNMGGANVKQQFLGGIPVTSPHTVLPTVGSFSGVPESCNNMKTRGSPQLTIFYAGTVNVFEDISPEKAQAIMLLAGNGSSIAPTMAQPKVQVQGTISKPTTVDGVTGNQPVNAPPGTGRSSPISVSSHTGTQSASGSTGNEEPMATKTIGLATPHICKLETPSMEKAGESGAATAVTSAGHSNFYKGIPQARKASLALFLEKRKQRVMNVAPYPMNKKSPEGSVLESNGFNHSVLSAATNDGGRDKTMPN